MLESRQKSTRRNPTSTKVRNGPERREAILAAALDLFHERGFENGTMRDIAKMLAFTQAALYYHFKSKDEIFFSILDRFTDVVLKIIKSELDIPGDPVSVLRSTIRRHVIISRDYSKEVKLLTEDRKLLSEEYAHQVRRKERKIFDLYRRHFERLHAANLLPSISPTTMTFALLAAANSVHQWYDRDGEMSIDDIAAQLGVLFLGPESIVQPQARKRSQPQARKRSKVR
jgi:TetR/AcrR family transcriptional regulator, cholesterol catabolism regulator